MPRRLASEGVEAGILTERDSLPAPAGRSWLLMTSLPRPPSALLSLEDCGNKGLGLVATSELLPGRLLLSEAAILRVTVMGDQLSPGAPKDVSRQFSR